MQFTMKLFEIMPQGLGNGAGTQKVAVKMPAQETFNGTAAEASFADIMAAFFGMPSAQLEDSLAHFETISAADAIEEQVPVIDLTQLIGARVESLEAANDPLEGGNDVPHVRPENLLGASETSRLLDELMTTGAIHENRARELASALQGLGVLPEADHGRLTPQAVIEQIIDQAAQTADGADFSEDTSKLSQPGAATLAQLLAAVQRRDKNAWQMPTERAEKVQATAVASASADLCDEAVQADAFTSMIDEGAPKKNGIAGPAVKSVDSQASGNFGEMVSSAAREKSELLDNGLVEPKLSEVSLKEQIRPQHDQQAGAQVTNPASQGNNPAQQQAAPQEMVAANMSTPTPTSETKSDTALHASHQTSEAPSDTREMQSDVIRQIVQRMTLRSDGRQSQMQIRLKPEFLGNLRMDVITENRLVLVRMTAESQAVKEMIEQNIGLLKTELQQHGLQIQKIDVTVSTDNNPWQSGQQQAAFDQARQRNWQGHNGRRAGRQGMEQGSVNAVDSGQSTTTAHAKTSEVDFFA